MAVVQVVVAQLAEVPWSSDGVVSCDMKFIPMIVLKLPPVVGEFALFGSQLAERTGASNVKIDCEVPMPAETVSIVDSPVDANTADEAPAVHLIADAAIQDTEVHVALLTEAVGVTSEVAKLKP